MVKLDKQEWKEKYFSKLKGLMAKYSKVLVVGVDNIRSKQMQEIRQDIRGRGELLMGKNTMIRKCFREMLEEYPHLEELMPSIVNNIGFCFTDMDLSECRDVLVKNKVQASAKAGIVAPVDVIIPAGPTSMGPEKTSFFQALNLNTKINKGTIEILQDTVVCKEGDKVGLSEAKLLNMLGISPFFYGLELQMIMDNGSIYPPAVLDITDAFIMARVSVAVSRVASISLAVGWVNPASVAHSIKNAFNKIASLSVMIDHEAKEWADCLACIKDPSLAAAAAAPVAAAADAPAAAKAPEPESESDEDDGEMSLFD